MKVLVIDDDALMRRTVARMLTVEGHDVFTAENGTRGMVMYRRLSPDLVITDMVMPDEQGSEIIIEIRRDDAKVKIIAISGGGRFSGPELLDTAILLGADDAIEKPFRIDELLNHVRAVAGKTGDGSASAEEIGPE